MKRLLLLLLMLTGLLQVSYAAFPVYNPADTTVRYTIPATKQEEQDTPQKRGGWAGITALVFGILGMASFYAPGAGIPAIVFGAIGMKRGRKHRGLAVAGFILGIVSTVILALALLFFIFIY